MTNVKFGELIEGTNAAITNSPEKFEEEYARKSGVSVDQLNRLGLRAVWVEECTDNDSPHLEISGDESKLPMLG